MRFNRGDLLSLLRSLLLLSVFTILLAVTGFPRDLKSESPVSADSGGGWYQEGAPVITKKDCGKPSDFYPSCGINVSSGSSTGFQTWYDFNSPGKCGGTYTGTITWTPPPAYLKPGDKYLPNLAAQITEQNSCGSLSMGAWVSIQTSSGGLNYDCNSSSKPCSSFKDKSFTVPEGKAGQKLAIDVNCHPVNLAGYCTYNYVYKGSGTPSTPKPPPTPSATTSFQSPDSPPGKLIDKLPKLQGEPMAWIDIIRGNGPVYVSADSLHTPPSKRNWVKVAPGDKVSLGEGYAIRTGQDALVVFMFSTGAKTVMLGKGWYEMRKQQFEQTAQSVVYTRLFEGICHFYVPKGSQGAKKWEIDANRVVVGIKGTILVLEVNDTGTTVKVLEGEVEYTSKVTKDVYTVKAGEKCVATNTGLAPKESFNIDQEKAKWASFDDTKSATTSTPSSTSTPKKKTKAGPFLTIASGQWNLHAEQPPSDQALLGRVWRVTEYGGWTATWTRRGGSLVFDGVWFNGSQKVTGVLTMAVQGRTVRIQSRQQTNGYDVDYEGTLSQDGRSIQGTLKVLGSGSIYDWKATIDPADAPPADNINIPSD